MAGRLGARDPGSGRDLRSYNFSVIPSEVVNEVLVTKTPVSNTVESGIGGSVDVQTLRPLEAKFDKDKNWIAQLDSNRPNEYCR